VILRYDENSRNLIIKESTKLEWNQVKLKLYRHVKGFRFVPAFKRGVWDGKVNHFHNGNIPFGLWKEILIALQEIECPFEIENKKDFPLNRNIKMEDLKAFCDEFFKDHYIIDKKTGEKKNFFPYDHQIETAYSILKNKFCTAEVATSGGKSLIISIVFLYILKYMKPDAKLLLIVPSITLVTQFYDDLLEYNYGKYKENKNPIDIRVQEIMSDKPRKWHDEGEPNIIISTYQSLSKVKNFGKEFYKQFYAVACDEAHMAKSDSFVKILKRTQPYTEYQFGVSGTFQDDGFAEYITIQSLTGPKVAKVKARELQEKGIVSWVRISQIHLNHNDPSFKEQLKEIRKNPNSGAAAYRLEGDYIRNSLARKEFISKLLTKISTNTLILFNIIDYGLELKDFLETKYIEQKKKDPNLPDMEFYMIYGEIKKDDREEIKKKMEIGKEKVEYTILNFGDYELELKSDFKILLSNGDYKLANNIDENDDIDDNFLEKIKNRYIIR
jgi:superfamily II DNA or RNA helicase